jgi:hypothetical protein
MAGLAFLMVLLASYGVSARTVEYDLVIAEEDVNITGKTVRGMTVNGGIPGPVLRFREGDFARIRVRNEMSVPTSIHWHGVLVPPGMDGVPFVNFPPIEPGTTFTYEFPIRQSGTYWYHSHTGLQEQKGVFGAIAIEPKKKASRPKSDHVVIFSDWTDEGTHEVLRTLKRGSDWYSIEKGTAQSIIGAARVGELGPYFVRELMRMPAMDVSDIAYDLFLANGKPQVSFSTPPGQTVRLRIINGSAGSNFLLEYAGGPMTIISADGQDVRPLSVRRLFIAIAETYDVLIDVPSSGAYEFRATSQDGSGHASVWLGSGERHLAPEIPRPDLYHAMGRPTLKRVLALTPQGAAGMPDREVRAGEFDNPEGTGMKAMAGMMKKKMKNMKMMANVPGAAKGEMAMEDKGGSSSRMDKAPPQGAGPRAKLSARRFGRDLRLLASDVASSGELAPDGMDARRPWPPYGRLCSGSPEKATQGGKVREIRLTLDGDMERYVWFINNRPLSESEVIRIRKGERVRFIMINRTMMHHPMHLHGHFFRVKAPGGGCSPLKHTVDVLPMSTTVIEFQADEVGDWFFHCHLLYHLKSGMASVVHYENFKITPHLEKVRPNLYKDGWYSWGRADVMSNMTEGFFLTSNTRSILGAQWEVGWQDVPGVEWEGILSYDRYFNRFLTLFTGLDLLGSGDRSEDTRGVFGLRYLLPLNIETRSWLDTDGGARFVLAKSLVLTPRIVLTGEVQYDTHDKWEGRTRLSYILGKNISLLTQWHSDYGPGAGVQIRF